MITHTLTNCVIKRSTQKYELALSDGGTVNATITASKDQTRSDCWRVHHKGKRKDKRGSVLRQWDSDTFTFRIDRSPKSRLFCVVNQRSMSTLGKFETLQDAISAVRHYAIGYLLSHI